MSDKKMLTTRHAELNLRYSVLRETCADLFERLNHLELMEGPNLASRYMMDLGQYEMRAFELTLSVRRWRRRFELRQRALNAGETLDLVAVEAELDGEFAAFMSKLKAYALELESSRSRLTAPTLTREQTTEVRCLYLNAAKRLHPDVNSDVTEAMSKLWLRIKAAYADRNWSELRFLCGLIDTVAARPLVFPKTRAGLDALTAEIARLENVVADQRRQIADMESRAPWSYAGRLDDLEAVRAEQEDLQDMIAALQEQVAAYERKWNEEVIA